MPDRLATLLNSTTLNGIDFVEVTTPDQTGLRVHFLTTVPVAGTLAPTAPVTITGGDAIPTVPVLPVVAADWSVDDAGRPLLALRTPFRGDFSTYTLTVRSTVLDAYYAQIGFTFKAGCPSTLDCLSCEEAAAPTEASPVIDYLAKDYAGFRAALLDYSTTAYPAWVERDEPDLGVVLAELLAAVGDDLSFLQDRIGLQAALPTATERVSAVRLARLVDYEPRPATSSRAWVQVDVTAPGVPVGVVVRAPQPDGGSLDFELGDGLVDHDGGELRTGALDVDPRWNRHDHSGSSPTPRMLPYLWDDAQECLRAGATRTWVAGHGFGFRVGDPQLGTSGIALLLDTAAPTAADAPVREVVHLVAAVEETDELLGQPVTRIEWDATEALRLDHALSRTHLAGNLVTATQGRRFTETYVVDPDPDGPDAPLAAVTRTGADTGCGDAVPVHSHTLGAGRLAWLSDADADGAPLPEVHVVQRPADPGDPPRTWRWRRSLLDAGLHEAAYTIDPVAYSDVRPDRTGGLPWFEYDGAGDSIRHGTGLFGELPVAGSAFDVTYRVGAGSVGDVAADSISVVPPELSAVLLSATNPFPSAGGADAETLEHVRESAPHAFRARQFRAVRAADYDATAREPAWVLDAGTAMRWTGSWLTVFTTAQPRTTEQLTLAEHLELVRLLGRRRIAGYEVYTPDPRYAGIDLVVTVCAQPWALRGEVEAAVLTELGTGTRRDGSSAFFAPGRLSFGDPVQRSELEAAAQAANGVDGVVALDYRRRGHVPDYVPMPETVTAARDEILRVANDPNHPDHGSLRVVVRGGK